jgi:hypothetical protein
MSKAVISGFVLTFVSPFLVRLLIFGDSLWVLWFLGCENIEISLELVNEFWSWFSI